MQLIQGFSLVSAITGNHQQDTLFHNNEEQR
jgi:hypothetical protein